MSNRLETLHILKLLIRQIDIQCTKPVGNTYWKRQLISEFRNNRSIDESLAVQKRREAKEYLTQLQSTEDYRKLIDVYQGEQISQKERLALSAHRVGLKLPEEERVPRKPLDTVTLTPQS